MIDKYIASKQLEKLPEGQPYFGLEKVGPDIPEEKLVVLSVLLWLPVLSGELNQPVRLKN
jgi:hypothetical protein